MGLLGSIPAFYLALQGAPPSFYAALYLTALTTTIVVVWKERRDGLMRAPASGYRVDLLGPALATGLLASALVPAGTAVAWVAVRLATAILVVVRLGDSLRPEFWRAPLWRMLPASLVVFGLYGLGFWWLEPSVNSFGDGLWLAFTTATTVGYGDLVPSSPASKIFAVFVVLTGVALLSIVTAAIASVWVQAEERLIEREMLTDLHHELRQIRSELARMTPTARL